jgi:hypothetical protein
MQLIGQSNPISDTWCHRKHRSSVVVCRPLPSNGPCTLAYRGRRLQGVYMPQSNYID